MAQNNRSSSNTLTDRALYLGVDGGGSKCRVKISTGDQVLGVGLAGPANPLHGVEQSKESIIAASEAALEVAGLSIEHINRLIAGIGLAGANLPACYEAINDWQHPFKALYVTTDLDIACLGAHQGRDGGVIIVGTGSSGYVSVKGRKRYLGGHGFPHGDKGSGAWIGLEAVKHILLALDNLEPKSLLYEQLMSEINCQSAISVVEYFVPTRSNRFASIAPMVFEAANAGDQVAVKIIKEAASYFNSLAKRLLELNLPNLSVLGGLSHLITPWLDEDVSVHIVPPKASPEDGAILFAIQESMGLAENSISR